MTTRNDCYGRMFPDLDALQTNQPLEGKAFGVMVRSQGIGIAGREVSVRADGWDQCTQCDQYRDCYDLSMAKLALGTALACRT